MEKNYGHSALFYLFHVWYCLFSSMTNFVTSKSAPPRAQSSPDFIEISYIKTFTTIFNDDTFNNLFSPRLLREEIIQHFNLKHFHSIRTNQHTRPAKNSFKFLQVKVKDFNNETTLRCSLLQLGEEKHLLLSKK